MGPRAGLYGRKISSPPGIDPARSQSLYRLSYRAHYRNMLLLQYVEYPIIEINEHGLLTYENPE